MEIRQLKQFRCLAESENMQSASNHLFISQSALSKSLKSLENELGVELFEREKRKLRLNHNGKIALAYTEIILNIVDEILDGIATVKEKESCRICSSSFSVLDSVIPYLTAALPQINISSEVGSYILKTKLLNDSADIVIAPYPFQHPEIINQFLFESQVLVAVPKSNPLSQKKELCLADLQGESFVETKRGNPPVIHYPNPLTAAGNSIRYTYAPTIDAVYREADRTRSLYFTDFLAIEQAPNPENRRFIPYIEKGYRYTYHVSYLKRKEKRLRPILDWLQGYFQETLAVDAYPGAISVFPKESQE